MSKNTLLSNLINYISANSSGNVVVAAPTSGFALDVTGTGRFTGALTLGSTITNGTFTYTLPSATGTLALTSSLGSYLPLSGGTLTGALGGTSATFSSSVQATRLSLNNTGTAARLQVNGVNSEPIAYLYNNSGTAGSVPGLAIEAGTNSSDYALAVGSSLGTSYLRVRGDGNVGIGTSSPGARLEIVGSTDLLFNLTRSGVGTWGANVTSAGNLFLTNRFGANVFQIADLGAATFSSSVTASGFIKGIFNSTSVGGPGSHGFEFSNATTTTKSLIGGYDSVRGAYIQAVNFGVAYENLSLNPNGGNVGIGTTAPSRLLTVVGGSGNGILINGFNSTTTVPTTGLSLNTGFNAGYISNYTTAGALADLYYNAAKHLFDGQIQSSVTGANVVTALFTNGAGDPNFKAGFANGSGTTVNSEKAKIGMWYGTSGTPIVHIGLLRGSSADSLGMTFNVAGSEVMRVTSDSSLAIGNTAGVGRLRIWSATSTSGSYPLTIYNATGVDLLYIRGDGYAYVGASTWVYGSDLRMKENISNVENGLDMVLKMKPKYFDYINGQKNNIGFIAQDIQKIIPQAVSITNKETGMLGLKTDFLVPMLVKAVQEQQAQIEELKQLINK